jgi:hypothetical protein
MQIDEGTKLLIESRVGGILAVVLIDERWIEDYVCGWEELAAFNGPELSNRSDKAIIKIDVHFQQIIKEDPQSNIVLVQDSINLDLNVGGVLLPLSRHDTKHLALLFLHFHEVVYASDLLDLIYWERVLSD